MQKQSSITIDLLQTLRRGAESLSDEARRRVCLFVESQRAEGAAFANRGGKADLYYTLFGWLLCWVLDIRIEAAQRKAFLQSFDDTRLDELHQTVLALCQLLHRLMPHRLSSLLFPLSAFLSPFSTLPSPDLYLRHFFETYQRHGSGGGTTAWAARLSMAVKSDSLLVERLLAVQHESGGFLAHEQAAMPDLLSTAVALFALHRHTVVPRYEASPFVEAHWQEDGSFAATLLDEHGDAEYEFYGLLALGSI